MESLLTALLGVVSLVVEGADIRPTIVGGSPIDIKDSPWHVGFQYGGGRHCGASIISTEWVLSAAHCAYGYDQSQMQLLVGTDVINEGGDTYSVDAVVMHEQYDNTTFINDICLLKASPVMVLDGTLSRAVNLPAQGAPRPREGTALRVTGWGKTEDGTLPRRLRMVEIIVQNFDKCKAFRDSNEEKQICASAPGKDSCVGDSGGPLVYGDVEWAIVSYGNLNKKCGDSEGVYTFLGAYRSWITANSGV